MAFAGYLRGADDSSKFQRCITKENIKIGSVRLHAWHRRNLKIETTDRDDLILVKSTRIRIATSKIQYGPQMSVRRLQKVNSLDHFPVCTSDTENSLSRPVAECVRNHHSSF